MKRIVALLLLLALLPLGGCLGGVSLDKYGYVLDLGVERGDVMPYRFVFLLNEDIAGSGEEGEDRGRVSMVSAEERSLFAAVDAHSGALSAQLSFERTTLLAFSRELAEAGEMEKIMEGALSRLKIRQNVRVVVEDQMQEAFRGLISQGGPSMNRLKTNVKLAMDTSDATIADLMTDGCDMGIKSLARYLNQYKAANESAKAITRRLIAAEESLGRDLRGYL